MSTKPGTAIATLPDGFGEIGPITLPEASRTPYVQFVSSKSKNYGELLGKIPSLREGEPVLVQPAPAHPVKLSPMKYFLLHATEFWGQYNQLGELVAVSSTKPEPTNGGPRYDQTIEATVLVVLEDRLVPAQVRFKSTKCPAVYPAIRAMEEAKTPAWGKKGDDYAFTLKIDRPWGRFTCSANRTTRTNREKGTEYQTMEAVVNPTSAADLTKLVKFLQDKDAMALLQDVAAQYRKRVEAAKAKELQPA